MTEFMFLTYTPELQSQRLRIWKADNSNISQFASWNREQTYFDSEELITLLFCLSIKTQRDKSVSSILYEDKFSSGYARIAIGSVAFPSKLKFDENRLEVFATASSLLNSSHHNHESRLCSLSGQDGVSFTKNLIASIINWSDLYLSQNITLTFDSDHIYDIKTVMEQLEIPFLYPSNCLVPEILQDLTNDGAINVKKCIRSADDKNISFDASSNSSPCSVVAYYENWPLTFATLETMLGDALGAQSSNILLIFCAKLPELTHKISMDALKMFCHENRVNLFRIENVDYTIEYKKLYHYNMVPIVDLIENPDLISIVFETHHIYNKTLIEFTN